MKIWIGCDHAGYPMKLEVLAMLQEQGYTVEDMEYVIEKIKGLENS